MGTLGIPLGNDSRGVSPVLHASCFREYVGGKRTDYLDWYLNLRHQF